MIISIGEVRVSNECVKRLEKLEKDREFKQLVAQNRDKSVEVAFEQARRMIMKDRHGKNS